MSILIPVGNQIEVIPSNSYVGKITNNVECEVAGIELALEQIAKYPPDIYNKEAFIPCDCMSAIDIVCGQWDISSSIERFRNIWKNLKMIRNYGVTKKILWCPGHCDIVHKDMAEEEAKRSAEQLSQLSSQ